MKKLAKSRIMVLVVVVALAMSTVQCGTILYGSHRGGDRIDSSALIMDCLWLLAGVLPGVVALVVDFSTGGIYEGGSRKSLNVHPGDTVAFRLRGAAPADAKVEVTLGAGDDDNAEQTLFLENFVIGEQKKDTSIFTIPSTLRPGSYRLVLKVNDIESAFWNLSVAR